LEAYCVLCEVRNKTLRIKCRFILVCKFLPWLRRLVIALSLLSPGFEPRSALVKFLIGKVSVLQVSLRVRVFRLSLVSIISPISHNNFYPRIALKRRTKGRTLEVL
jgi:hypothetical protein